MENQEIKKWIVRIIIIWLVIGAAVAGAAIMGWIGKQEFMITFLAGMVLFAATTGALNNQLVANREKESQSDSLPKDD